MTKRPKLARTPLKPKKRGPRNKQRASREDLKAAVDRLQKIDRATEAEFVAADKDGKDALKRHDIPAPKDAIQREGEAVGEHIRLTKTIRSL